jgi:threonyl-tRNA synthetase
MAEELKAAGIRVELDARGESVGKKIREATVGKIPYMVVVGEKEAEAHTVAVRTHKGEDLGTMTIEALREKLTEEVRLKK